jgi:membrane-associated phospholipid phosphatase
MPPLRRFIRDRLSPGVATGIALTVAVVAVVVTGSAVGLLSYLIRHDAPALSFDRSVESWADRVATPQSDAILGALTHLGATVTLVVLAVAVAVWCAVRRRTLAAVGFLTVVIAGQALVANLIKVAVARARPALDPRASFSGDSFPSGHTTAAAATFLALALVLAIGRPPRARAVLFATAVAVGVAVACTRVLLGVHWTSDALAGLALGWTWYAVAAVAFGGRLLRYGATAEVAATTPPHEDRGVLASADLPSRGRNG